MKNGSVVAWGRNDYGQSTVPVAAQSGIKAIAAGGYHNAALKNDGSVVAWGFNSDGQTDVPTGLTGVQSVAADNLTTMALKHDGTVVTWGSVRNGFQNGLASYVPAETPLGLHGVTAISCGGRFYAILGDGTYAGLQATHIANKMILAWPTNFTGSSIQSTTDLTPPVAWTDWSGIPAIVGRQFTVTNPITNGRQFFRLVRPYD